MALVTFAVLFSAGDSSALTTDSSGSGSTGADVAVGVNDSSARASSGSRSADAGGREEDDAVLDMVDAHLPAAARRTRMQVCMEYVQVHAMENAAQVRLYVQQTSDRLSERDAKNYLFHNMLVNCYFGIQQVEVDSFGAEDMSAWRRTQVLARPSKRPRLRFSARQTEVLDAILRDAGAAGAEVEVLGLRLSSLPRGCRLALAATGLLLCTMLLVCLAAALLRRRQAAGGGRAADGAQSAKKGARALERGAAPAPDASDYARASGRKRGPGASMGAAKKEAADVVVRRRR